jgi:hypothetical protein
MGVYGGVINWGKDPRIAARVETFGQMRSILTAAKPLPPAVLAALGDVQAK